MTKRADLLSKPPREILLEKHEFISFDLHTRSLQWPFTKTQPRPLSTDSKAYKFAGFGTHEIVVYYDLFRYLLEACFAGNITGIHQLERLAVDWLNHPEPDFSGRTPAHIIESERRRINLTASTYECLIDENCETCEKMAAEFATPLFWGLDGSNMEYDRFEFSFEKTVKIGKQNNSKWKNLTVNLIKNVAEMMMIFLTKTNKLFNETWLNPCRLTSSVAP